MPVHWVGIDEAGYGPNLGPLVMTAVVAESLDERAPDVWADLAPAVARAGGDPHCLWVDDSKALYKPGSGRDRLEAACLALLAAADPAGAFPASVGGLLAALGAGSLEAAELARWLDGRDPPVPSDAACAGRVASALAARPFSGAAWRVVAVRTAVVGPAAFNAGLAAAGANKARVHFGTFVSLLRAAWALAPEGVATRARGDKHGGRHFYYGPLVDAFPETWIDRGVEGPGLSRYTLRHGSRRLELGLEPRADGADGLVALASVVSKTVRELWMDAFNAHWGARLPGLRPTAGYPVDAARFRSEVEPLARRDGLDPTLWWRAK